MKSFAKDISDDMGITDAKEFKDITRIAINYVSKDPRINVEPKGKEALWIYHKGT